MWRKPLLTGILVTVFVLGLAGLAFAAGLQVVSNPTTMALASRLPLFDAVLTELAPAQAGTTPEDLEDEFAVFWDVWRIIENDFFGEIDRSAMIQGAIEGMVESLGDPHTRYVTPEHNALMRENDQGSFQGIGATVDMVDGRLVVIAPIKNSPAERAGLQPGDVILRVDGTIIEGMDLLDAVSLVRGPKGSTVELTIQREGVKEPFDVSVIRDEIPLITVESRMLDDRIGYLAIHSFGGRTVKELDANLRNLEREGVQALILDLRGNPGGFLDGAVETVSRFVGAGPVLWWEEADGSMYPIRVKPRRVYGWPMVVLIDEGSASASEIVAGALQDTGRATLIGTQSFGKGSVQNVHQLRNGGAVRVTTAHWLTPNKHEIQGVGLKPDIQIAQNKDTEGDDQLGFARRLLQSRFARPYYVP